MKTLKIKAFNPATAEDIISAGLIDFDDYEKDPVIYKHAYYIRYILNSFMAESQDLIEKDHDLHGIKLCYMIFSSSRFEDILAEDEFSAFYTRWYIYGYNDQKIIFDVVNGFDGIPFVKFEGFSNDANIAINNIARENFQHGYRREIALAKKMVYESDTDNIRKTLKQQHDVIAKSLGVKNSGHTPLYSYNGEIPVGKTWAFTDVVSQYGENGIKLAQYEEAVNRLLLYAGEESSDSMWSIIRFDHWAVKWIERVAIQCFFNENIPWMLTPIFIYWYENIYDQWQEWEELEYDRGEEYE